MPPKKSWSKGTKKTKRERTPANDSNNDEEEEDVRKRREEEEGRGTEKESDKKK